MLHPLAAQARALRSVRRRDETGFERPLRERGALLVLGHVPQLEGIEQRAHMRLHRLHPDDELVGDLPVIFV